MKGKPFRPPPRLPHAPFFPAKWSYCARSPTNPCTHPYDPKRKSLSSVPEGFCPKVPIARAQGSVTPTVIIPEYCNPSSASVRKSEKKDELPTVAKETAEVKREKEPPQTTYSCSFSSQASVNLNKIKKNAVEVVQRDSGEVGKKVDAVKTSSINSNKISANRNPITGEGMPERNVHVKKTRKPGKKLFHTLPKILAVVLCNY